MSQLRLAFRQLVFLDNRPHVELRSFQSGVGCRGQPSDAVIKVLVCAKSTHELSRLESAVRSAPSLELIGSSLGGPGLRQQLEDTQADVLLEYSVLNDPEELPDLDPSRVARVCLVTEAEFARAFAGIQALDSALRGVLPVWASVREIQIAVEAVANGLLVLHPDVAEQVDKTPETLPRGSSASLGQQLSARENEILNLLAAGLGNKEIARRLKISDHTVKFHITSIFNKLSVSNRTEAVAVGIRRGLIVL